MVEKISITTFAILLVVVIFVSIFGTVFVLSSFGMLKVGGPSTSSGVVTVNVIIPNVTQESGKVGVNVVTENATAAT